MAHVVAVNLEKRLALLSDGRSVTITTLLDVWGDETTDEKSAVSFVAGGGREWFCDAVSAYEGVTTQ